MRQASLTSGSWRVFEMSLGEMLWSRRTIFMAIVVTAPVLLALVARVMQMSGVPLIRSVNGMRVDAAGLFAMLVWNLFLRFVVPVLGVFYGTALVADEVEDKTITYLFTRPIRRAAVLIGKFLAYLVCSTLVVLPSVMLVYLLLVPFGEMAGSFPSLVIDLGLLALGLATYGALFALVGTVMKRPVLFGLLFAFGWDQLLQIVPGYLKRFTVAYYLHALVPHTMPSEGLGSLLLSAFSDRPSAATSIFWLLAILGLTIGLAAVVVERREYVLEQ